MARASVSWLAAGALALALAAGAARGDDWPQFRRDAGRTAASSDPLKLPFTEVWTWTTFHRDGHSPLFNVAVWHNRVFFTACEGDTRFLVCADAKRGSVFWKQPLVAARLRWAPSDAVGPA